MWRRGGWKCKASKNQRRSAFAEKRLGHSNVCKARQQFKLFKQRQKQEIKQYIIKTIVLFHLRKPGSWTRTRLDIFCQMFLLFANERSSAAVNGCVSMIFLHWIKVQPLSRVLASYCLKILIKYVLTGSPPG